MAVTEDFKQQVAEALDELGYSVENENDVIDNVDDIDDDVTLPGIRQQNGVSVGYVSMKLAVIKTYLNRALATFQTSWNTLVGTVNTAIGNANDATSAANTAAGAADTATGAANTAADAAIDAAANASSIWNQVKSWFNGSNNNGFKTSAEGWLTDIQSTWTSWFGASDTSNNSVRKAWNLLHSQAGSDHTRAEDDHTTAGTDHSRAEGDHTTAGTDHATAGTDHSQAGTDHSRAEGDHTTAGTDHATAGTDHTLASQDHQQAVSDHRDSVAATDLAEEYNSHPPYIADGTQAKPGDVNYWYVWSHTSQQYVKNAYARGSDLDYSEMTEAEKNDLAGRVSEVNFNAQTGNLTKTKNGQTSNIVQVYTKAQIDAMRSPTYNPATRIITFPATAAFSYDPVTKVTTISH
jgi:uncharacterized protein YjbJ (UPF0337 family)